MVAEFSAERVLAETAQLLLWVLMNDAEAYSDAFIQLQERPFMMPFAASSAELQRARADLGLGNAGAALAGLDAIAPSLGEASYNLDWETFYATRIAALLALGRVDEAREAMPAALARLAVSLEGGDEAFLQFATTEIVVIRKLLGMAERLGVAYRHAPAPANRLL